MGQTIVTLELASRPNGPEAPPLPPHKLSPHDVVCLRPNKSTAEGEPLASGVVYRIRDTQIELACDDVPEELSGTLRLERLSNEATHKRLVAAVERVGKYGASLDANSLARTWRVSPSEIPSRESPSRERRSNG